MKQIFRRIFFSHRSNRLNRGMKKAIIQRAEEWLVLKFIEEAQEHGSINGDFLLEYMKWGTSMAFDRVEVGYEYEEDLLDEMFTNKTKEKRLPHGKHNKQ